MTEINPQRWAAEAYSNALVTHDRLWGVRFKSPGFFGEELTEPLAIEFHRMRLRERESFRKLVDLRKAFLDNPRGLILLQAGPAWKAWISNAIAAAAILEPERKAKAKLIQDSAFRAAANAKRAMQVEEVGAIEQAKKAMKTGTKIGIIGLVIAGLGTAAGIARLISDGRR